MAMRAFKRGWYAVGIEFRARVGESASGAVREFIGGVEDNLEMGSFGEKPLRFSVEHLLLR